MTARPVTPPASGPEVMPLAEFLALTKGGKAGRSKSRRPQPAQDSDIEVAFSTLLRLYLPDVPTPEKQYRYAPGRNFAADYAFVDARLLIECEGIFGGAHGSITGILMDCERSRIASMNGWRVFRVTSADLKDRPSEIFDQLRTALADRADREKGAPLL